MIRPTRSLAVRTALRVNGFVLGAWEAARLLALGDGDGPKKVARLEATMDSLSRSGDLDAMRYFVPQCPPLEHYRAMLEKVRHAPFVMEVELSDVAREHTLMFRPLLL